MFGAEHRSRLLRDELSSDSHDRRRKTELTSRLSRNLIRRRKIYSLFLGFRSIGVVFSLTTEGHIDVRYILFYLVKLVISLQEKG